MDSYSGLSREETRSRAEFDLATLRMVASKLVETLEGVKVEDYVIRIGALAKAIDDRIDQGAVCVFAAIVVDMLRAERYGG